MAGRERHQNKDIEAVMRGAEEQGWAFERSKGYYKGKCSCREKHMKWIHLTPSGGNYAKNLRHWFERQSCWPGKGNR